MFNGNGVITQEQLKAIQQRAHAPKNIWHAGGHLDSVRDLAAAAGVNPNTMQRALAQLENEGLVRTERTAGRYVTEDRALIEQLRAEAARNLTAEFLEKMRGIGYGPEQAAALLERWNEKEETNHD